MPKSWMRALACALALCAPVVAFAQADDYPNRPVRVIVPFPPGGPSDTITRMISERLSEQLKQPFVVENRAGAGGTLGLGIAAKAPADGYTLALIATSTYAISPSLYPSLPFDADKDFAPVAQFMKIGNVLLVNPQVPATDLKSLVALMRASPKSLNGGYPGAGNSAHIALVLFEKSAGAETVRVPYKGDADGMNALIANQIQVYFTVSFVAAPQIRAGKLRGIAIASPVRSPGLPDIPTFAEAGMPGFIDTTAYFGAVTNAGAPAAVVRKLNEEVHRALADPKVRDYLLRIGAVPGSGSVAEFTDYLRAERARWAQAVKDSGAKVE